MKLIILKYFSSNYIIFQKFKYFLDNIYHKKYSYNKDLLNFKNLQEDQINHGEIINKKLIIIKSGLNYPTKDGFTIQFYNFLNYENPMREKLREVKLKIEYAGDEEFNYEDSIVLIIKLLRNII